MSSQYSRPYPVIYAAILLLTGVAAGAFGTHGLRFYIGPSLLEVWRTAVMYQIIHALGILVVYQLSITLRAPVLRAACHLMLLATLCFSGSLYVLVITGEHKLGAVTPLGGLLFIAAWTVVAAGAWFTRVPRQRNNKESKP